MSKIKHKHTPGPWKRKHVFGGNNQIYGLAGEYITRDVDNGERYVCRMDGSTHAAIGQIANANLISAAPELLQAVEHSLKVTHWLLGGERVRLDNERLLDVRAEEPPIIRMYKRRIDNLTKLIKKAKGE